VRRAREPGHASNLALAILAGAARDLLQLVREEGDTRDGNRCLVLAEAVTKLGESLRSQIDKTEVSS